MFKLIRNDHRWDFAGQSKPWLLFSALMAVISLTLFFGKGMNLGIDFTGGAEVQVQIPSNWDITQLRQTMIDGGVKGVKVVQIGSPEKNEFLIKAQGDDDALDEKALTQVTNEVKGLLDKNLEKGSYTILATNIVGPAAGSSLRKQGFLAMFYAMIAILIYVAVRFDSRYAPAAVVALFYDCFIVLGVFVLAGKTFDLSILASILALIGYSLNDKLIIFDRIREVQYLFPKMNIKMTVNKAINETMPRTIVTSITTILVATVLWQLGGAVIADLAYAMLLGIVVGTFSSIFVASFLVIEITHFQERRALKRKLAGKKKTYKVRPEPTV